MIIRLTTLVYSSLRPLLRLAECASYRARHGPQPCKCCEYTSCRYLSGLQLSEIVTGHILQHTAEPTFDKYVTSHCTPAFAKSTTVPATARDPVLVPREVPRESGYLCLSVFSCCNQKRLQSMWPQCSTHHSPKLSSTS